MVNATLRIAAFDPGFASFGFCVLTASPRPAGKPPAVDAERAGVIRTEKASKKSNTFASDDIIQRAQTIRRALLEAAAGAHLMAAESLSYPRNASTSAVMGVAFGVLASVAAEMSIPLINASPQAVKKALVGQISASKLEIEAAACARLPSLAEYLDDLPKGEREHASDAGAVGLWATGSPQALGLLRAISMLR